MIPDLKRPTNPSFRRCQTPFRFLDLPPETRNEIYFWSSLDHKPLRLKNFLTPSISRVSRQLRHECLPVFFKINSFVAEVRSTFMGFAWEATGYNPRYADRRYLEYSRTGAVSLKKDVCPLMNSYWASLARFTSLDFVLLHPFDAKDGRTIHRNAVLSVRGRVASVQARPSTSRKRLQDYVHLRYILSLGAKVVQGLARDCRFSGLSFENIKAVAAAFRADSMDSQKSTPKRIESYHYRPRASRRPQTIPLSTYRRTYHTPSPRLSEPTVRLFTVQPKQLSLNLYKQLTLAPITPMVIKQEEDDFDLNDAESYFDSPSVRKVIDILSDEDYPLSDAESYFNEAASIKKEGNDGENFDLPNAESYFDALKDIKITVKAAHFLGL